MEFDDVLLERFKKAIPAPKHAVVHTHITHQRASAGSGGVSKPTERISLIELTLRTHMRITRAKFRRWKRGCLGHRRAVHALSKVAAAWRDDLLLETVEAWLEIAHQSSSARAVNQSRQPALQALELRIDKRRVSACFQLWSHYRRHALPLRANPPLRGAICTGRWLPGGGSAPGFVAPQHEG